MVTADSDIGGSDDHNQFPVGDVVQCHPPDNIAPASLAFGPDYKEDKVIACLGSPGSTMVDATPPIEEQPSQKPLPEDLAMASAPQSDDKVIPCLDSPGSTMVDSTPSIEEQPSQKPLPEDLEMASAPQSDVCNLPHSGENGEQVFPCLDSAGSTTVDSTPSVEEQPSQKPLPEDLEMAAAPQYDVCNLPHSGENGEQVIPCLDSPGSTTVDSTPSVEEQPSQKPLPEDLEMAAAPQYDVSNLLHSGENGEQVIPCLDSPGSTLVDSTPPIEEQPSLKPLPEDLEMVSAPQSDVCNLPHSAENGELTALEDEEVRNAAAVLVRLAPSLFEDLCGPCSLLLQQRLARLSPSGAPANFQERLSSRSPGELATSCSEVTKTVLPSSVYGRHDATIADTISVDSNSGTVGRQEKPRLWSEERSSSSELDEELLLPTIEDHQSSESEISSTPAAAPPAKVSIPTAVVDKSQGTPDVGKRLSFHNEKLNFAWANASLPSPQQGEHEEQASSPLEVPEEESVPIQNESPIEAHKLSREAREDRRLQLVERKKDFVCMESIRGYQVNVAEGLELHCKMFSKVEQEKLIDFVYECQQKGRDGLLRGRTYSEPRKWMPGKGRVTIQFGCCYNYAQDSKGNPPGIMQYEHVDPLPNLLKATIRRLIKWHVLPERCVPDSCIINIYDVEDCIPPHIDHHDFVRPFCTLSLLSECNIVFGSKLTIVGDGQFDGPLSIPLPVGSVLVLKGNGADMAKHAVPGVPTKRISITFRKMNPMRVPRGYELPKDLRGIKALPHHT